jgi:CTP:molybdopterin cytidylyltransferase MocA
VSVLAVVLAAGRGDRFRASGGAAPKVLTTVGGQPLVRIAVARAIEADIGPVVVVQGAVDLSAHVPADVTLLDNPRWAEGIATSLHVAIEHARGAGLGALVVGLADQPGVPAAAWQAVAAADDSPPIAVATYDGRRANPVRLAAGCWDLLPTEGDEGARSLMRRRPDLVREVPCTGEPRDIDTMEDLEGWT